MRDQTPSVLHVGESISGISSRETPRCCYSRNVGEGLRFEAEGYNERCAQRSVRVRGLSGSTGSAGAQLCRS